MKYKELLMKYMNHVGYHEGINYTECGFESDIFTDEEWQLIRELSKESTKLKGEK